MRSSQIISWAEAHPTLAIGAGVLAAVLAYLAYRVVRSVLRSAVLFVRKIDREERTEDVLTYVAAAIATGVAGHGMWSFFDKELPNLPLPLKLAFFGFLEFSVLTCAVRARRNVRKQRPAGVDGTAVWVITGVSAFLATIEADSFGLGILRMIAPLVAAWLWERGMSVERERAGGRRLAWKVTPERILAKLRLVDPTDRDASEVAVQRYITRLALRAKRLRMLPEDGSWKHRRAARKLDRAMDQAVEYAGLASSPERREMLLNQIGALYNTRSLAYVELPSPWVALPLPVVDVRGDAPVTSDSVDVSTARRLEIATSGRLEIDPPAPTPTDADRIIAYLTERSDTSVGHSAPDDDPDDSGPGRGAPSDAPRWSSVLIGSGHGAPSDPSGVGHAPGHDPRPAPVPVSFLAPVGHSAPPMGHDDPFAGHDDPFAGHDDPGPVDVLGQASGAAWVRAALDDLGLYAGASDVAQWLDRHGVDVTEDAMRSEIKRARARARARATSGIGADVVPITRGRA